MDVSKKSLHECLYFGCSVTSRPLFTCCIKFYSYVKSPKETEEDSDDHEPAYEGGIQME